MHSSGEAQSEITNRKSEIFPSAFRAWCVLVIQSFQRHWRVRQMGWVSLGLLVLVVGWVVLVTTSVAGWELQDRRVRRASVTYRQYSERLLPQNRYDLQRNPPLTPYETPSP